ncbi:EF-hand domain-containing protein D2 homolog isoform X2 [Drosophila ananassae]|uniref:EF-hand domain-containing protein D2 homolog isoform X2 n=1 Tax=Drosophila ananassae TaxID=7217 RepID=UPI001CFFFD73|nr:EF-hand domain-containing protein D2 homolog isoform X2 [Drosophila ananassae]
MTHTQLGWKNAVTVASNSLEVQVSGSRHADHDSKVAFCLNTFKRIKLLHYSSTCLQQILYKIHLKIIYDTARDGFLDLQELKFMMEKLGAPQTHLGLKKMIAEVDEDHDGKISFREFLLIYRKAGAGELDSDSGLNQLARLTEIDVEQVGVSGAKNFFEAKIEQQLRTNKFHDEIRAEQEERRREEEERAQRRQQFQQRAAIFQ